MADEICQSIEIEAPVERVWDAIATQEGLRGWLSAELRFTPRIGGRVELAGVNGEEPYRYGGAVVELERPRRVTWEWDAVPPRWPQPTQLTLSVTPTAQGVRVELRHHGWERLPPDERDAAFAAFQQFWHGDELIPLKQQVEGVGPTY